MPKQLFAISFSHRNTGLDERDALAFTSENMSSFIDVCREKWSMEAAILSTCNRSEFYLHGPGSEPIWNQVKPLVAQLRQLDPTMLPEPAIFQGEAAALHLFRVAASLESIALGENQILAQIKDVHEQILTQNGKSPMLDRLFQYAIRVGKRVRTETSLCEGALSISSAAVDLAEKIFGNFRSREILIVGAGETAEAAAMHFRSSGADRFVVLNRSPERGAQVAERIGATYRPLDEISSACESADVAVFATGARDYLLTYDDMKRVMRARSHRPIFLIDISNPRNVDPEITRHDSAFLYNIDDLEQVVAGNLSNRKNEIPAALEIIHHMVREWQNWQQTIEVTPTIASLARFFEEVRTQEVDRHGGISEEERARLDEFSRGLVKKLLHNPIMYLRSAVTEDRLRSEDLELVSALYNLSRTEDNADES